VFGHEVVRAGAHGRHGEVLGDRPRDDQERQVDAVLGQDAEGRRGAEPGHRVVGDHEVEGVPPQGRAHGRLVVHAHREDLVTGARQLADDQRGVVLGVLDDEEAQRGHRAPPVRADGGTLSTSQ
jgi:hypothetical protein